jgi:hypothetical protein
VLAVHAVEFAASSAAALILLVAILNKGAAKMVRTKSLRCGVVLACSVFLLARLPVWSDDKNDKDKPALAGVWVLKGGELKIKFADKNVVKFFPHGDNDTFTVICEYSVEKEGRVKAKITNFEGKDEAKEAARERLPVGTEFSFTWKAKDGAAKLSDVKGDKVELLKSHLEGEYSMKK